MLIDLAETRDALAAAVRGAEFGDAGAIDGIRTQIRRIYADAWRRVALGETQRPAEWLEALRPGLAAARKAGNPEVQALVSGLEDGLGLAAAVMPEPLPASGGPRTDAEQEILDVLAAEASPLVRSEVHRKVERRGNVSISPQGVGQALERMAARGLVVRRREPRQGASRASLWQIAPLARKFTCHETHGVESRSADAGTSSSRAAPRRGWMNVEAPPDLARSILRIWASRGRTVVPCRAETHAPMFEPVCAEELDRLAGAMRGG